MDPHPDEEKKVCGSENKPLDSKLYSPLHSQLQAELGSSGIYYSDSNYLNYEANGNAEQLPSGTEESDLIYQMLDSFVYSLYDFPLEDQQEFMSLSEFPNNTMDNLDHGFFSKVEADNVKAMVSGTFLVAVSFLKDNLTFLLNGFCFCFELVSLYLVISYMEAGYARL